MARISTGKTEIAPPAKKSAKGKAAESAAAAPAAVTARPLARRRAKVLVVFAVVMLLGWGAQAIWRHAAPVVASRDRYLLPAKAITITPPPEWIVADVRGQVIHSAGLDGRLSILDAEFEESIKHAFALHPWVQSVDRTVKSFPPGVHVEVTYRRPVAVIETARGDLLPVDAAGSHLPADDVLLIRRKSLPRITGIVGQPLEGQRWEDARVPGALEIIGYLTDGWESLHLETITPRARPEIRDERQFFVYDIVTRGGTRIIWGASPHAGAPGESPFAVKLDRLKNCVKQYGPLDSVKAPGTVDVRGELHVEPRMVKQPGDDSEDATVVK
ncbi:MAG: hypothetical protein H0T51_20625 [Pirellulales bacterium]|nr:hypothetical protein [Pirellulales bacterium]